MSRLTTHQRTAQSEFPDIAIPEEVQALVREGVLTDTSWHNDVCASFELATPGQGFRLWVDYDDPSRREGGPSSPRFVIVRCWWFGCGSYGGWVPDGQSPVVQTEDVDEVVAFLFPLI